MQRALAAVLLLAACGDDGASTPIDATPPADEAPADAAETCTPTGECTWLVPYQTRIVSQLAGGSEITPGVTLTNRASIFGRDHARTFLLAELTALGLTPERDDYTFMTRTGANVIATLAPTMPIADAAPILVGAHFDSVMAGPGAGDNATGVAIVLAAARYLQTVETRNRPVIFALFDQEELGLIGSRAYVEKLETAGTQLRGAHIFDMLSFDGDGDRTVELWSPSPELKTLYETHGPAAGTPISSVTFTSSDHQAFLEAGFVAVGIGEEFVGGDHTPHYHKSTDTFANVQFDHLATVTHLALAALEADVSAP